MAGDEIHRHVFLRAVLNESIGPGRLRRGRPAYTKSRVYSFQSSDSVVVEIPVGSLSRIAAPEINIGFVPDFEIPLAHLINAVPREEMSRELGNEIIPLGPVFWRRNVRLIPKSMGHVLRRQLFWHEAELNKRPYAIFQQTIVDLIDIRKVINRLSLLILVIDTNLIVKDGVEADVLEPSDLSYLSQILAIAVS